MKHKKFAAILLASLTITTSTATIVAPPLTIEAHSGRTDSSGGHKDNQNDSGLGSYHYHCGGNPPHLHTNGVCPYADTSSKTATQSTPVKLNANTQASPASSSSKAPSSSTATATNDPLQLKYKIYLDDFNNKAAAGYFKQNIHEAASQFMSNSYNYPHIELLLYPYEFADLVEGGSSAVKEEILSTIVYLRVYEIFNNLVVQTQTKLSALGYYTGPIDGVFGPRTRQAVTNFQTAYGLVVDGTINHQVVYTLLVLMK